ncbi:hypothetical protein GCM10007854_17990 [Algimonas porphyrae]|uniref:Uncharacterized protein n=1 Tax=Algimonas porphyrae TaxID=1128113 RepID=A0ABQ5V0Z9_9PROT|nr:hypothetical protein GCM10007854_17990 [Algimonas porphyrae]
MQIWLLASAINALITQLFLTVIPAKALAPARHTEGYAPLVSVTDESKKAWKWEGVDRVVEASCTRLK